MITKLNRHMSNVVRWLQSAASQDDARQILTGIRCNDYSVACDGLRIHAVPDKIVEHEDGETQVLNFGKIRAGENIVEPERVDTRATYPNVEAIYPTGEPVMEIAIDPRILIECIKGFPKGKPALLRFYGDNNPFEVFGKIETGKEEYTDAYAVIMPMHKQTVAKVWKPTKQE
jgi:hypothetical protein